MSELTEMERFVARILDHPSVYMGEPSHHNQRRAREILAEIDPLIRQRSIERLQKLAPSFQKVGDTSEWADGYRAGARDALDAAAMVIKDMNEGDRP